MNMKDFHAWVKAGNFDKPKMGDDSAHTARLQETNKDVLSTIAKISGQKPNTQPRTNLTEKMSTVAGPPGRNEGSGEPMPSARPPYGSDPVIPMRKPKPSFYDLFPFLRPGGIRDVKNKRRDR
jgi:hypothetical protein